MAETVVGTAPPPLWPFAPAQEITEVLEWRTEVLQTGTTEQRIALRAFPRESVTLRHRCNALGMARAAELVRAGYAGDWSVPLWHLAVQPGTDLVQGMTEVPLDPADTELFAPGLAALAVDGGEASLIEVASVAADRLILSAPLTLQLPTQVVAAHRIRVAPVRSGLFTAPVEITRTRQNDGLVTAGFLLRGTTDLAPPVLPTYLGLPVQTDPSILRAPITASFSQAVEFVDSGLGPVVVEPLREVFTRGEAITLRAVGTAARRQVLRRWVWSLRGRQASFWLPTWGHELQLRAPMTASSMLMRVAPVAEPAAYVGRAIALELAGALRFRTITAAILEGLEHRLTLSSDLGEPVPVGTKVHFLTRVRSDADRIELRHGATASVVTLPVVDVTR